ncbi:MAG: hypothetical protein ABI844_19070 [Saprospiraceae bacterium]
MTISNKLEKLASEKNAPCVSISLNTHRTHPECLQDVILLKNLLKEAEDRVIEEFGKRSISSLLEKMTTVSDEIDINYNLDSLHIFLSNDTKEVIKSAWPISQNEVHISETFAIRPLIKMYNRSEEYLLLLLSQSGVQLFTLLNDGITSEVRNEDFPFSEISHYIAHSNNARNTNHSDSTLQEFLNKVDKAIQKVHNETQLNCVVISTEHNYSGLMQVADKSKVYIGHALVDNHNVTDSHLAKQGWDIVKVIQEQRRNDAISEINEAISKGNVLTDLHEIYLASMEGRGELLAVNQDFEQPVLMSSDTTFELVTDITKPKVIDDITSNIAWAVLSKKGRVVFIDQDKLKDLGNIALKTRY